jgi:hypothetical protein
MDREGHDGARGGGTGTADPVDTSPADADGYADAETLPLARAAQAPIRARPSPTGRHPSPSSARAPLTGRPSSPGVQPSPPGARSSRPDTYPSPPGTHPSRPGTDPFPAGTRPSLPTVARQLGLLACYLAVGVAVTWPRAAYLAGSLPSTRDAAAYVWGFWWVARQLTHLGNPWATGYLAAPVGTQLAYHTLMPLPGALMTPVTLTFGPSASYNLLSIACPGLLCYAMYRAARLWLPTGFGAIAAGAFFGLSSNLTWRSWYQLNLALGALFLPLTLAAAIRLRRAPGRRQAAILGTILGAALLTDQESAVLAGILAVLVLIAWLVRPSQPEPMTRRDSMRQPPRRDRLRLAAVCAGTAALVASPQIIAMIWQAAGGGASTPPYVMYHDYSGSGAGLVQMFAPSPRLAAYGMANLAALYYHGRGGWVVIGYGLVVSVAALVGLVATWRRPGTRQVGLLWLGCSLLALGPVPWIFSRAYHPLALQWHGVAMSTLMPFTWFVRVPGLGNFREAARFTELGLVAAALLAGAAVNWLSARARPVLVVLLTLGLLEAGWSGNPTTRMWPIGVMPTALPALDAPIAADHSHAIVVDVPFGIRGGLPVTGRPFPPESMVLATADGHPLADGYASRIPSTTLAGIAQRPFYAALLNLQTGLHPNTSAQLRAARRSARLMHVGWVLVWVHSPAIRRFLPRLWRFLPRTGFRFDYRADGVSVYRRVSGIAGAASGPGGPASVAASSVAASSVAASSVAASSSRPSAASPRTRPRSPAASPARSSADKPARIRA